MKYLLAIVFPPLAILLCGKPIQAIVNIPLCLMYWLPGAIHALLVVANFESKRQTKTIVNAIKSATAGVQQSKNGNGPFKQKIVLIAGFTENQRAQTYEKEVRKQTGLGWEVVDYRDNGAFDSKLFLRRPLGSQTWKTLDGEEKFVVAFKAALTIGFLCLAYSLFHGTTEPSAATSSSPDAKSGKVLNAKSQNETSAHPLTAVSPAKEKKSNPITAEQYASAIEKYQNTILIPVAKLMGVAKESWSAEEMLHAAIAAEESEKSAWHKFLNFSKRVPDGWSAVDQKMRRSHDMRLGALKDMVVLFGNAYYQNLYLDGFPKARDKLAESLRLCAEASTEGKDQLKETAH